MFLRHNNQKEKKREKKKETRAKKNEKKTKKKTTILTIMFSIYLILIPMNQEEEKLMLQNHFSGKTIFMICLITFRQRSMSSYPTNLYHIIDVEE